ncbi:MAG: hypothetical protein WCO06_06860 [Candidatus Roizmanbacteria bacterium]
MEDQNTIIQDEKPKINWWMNVSILLFVVVFALIGYIIFLLDRYKMTGLPLPTKAIPAVVAPTVVPTVVVPTMSVPLVSANKVEKLNTTNVPVMSLSDSLSKYCLKDTNGQIKISLDRIPVILSQEIKRKYSISDKIECAYPDGNYLIFSFESKGSDPKTYNDVYLYHARSTFMGMNDNFAQLSTFHRIDIADKKVFLRINFPDPLGFTNLGFSIDVFAEKQNEINGTIVRIKKGVVIKTGPAMDLMKKYAKLTPGSSMTEYQLDQEKVTEYEGQLFKLAPQLSQIIQVSNDLYADLDGVVFK